MSLINQMLRDLDSRKPKPSVQPNLPLDNIAPSVPIASNVPLLQVEESLLPSWLLYGVVGLGLGLSLFAGWRYWLAHGGAQFMPASVAQVKPPPAQPPQAAPHAALPKPGPEPPSAASVTPQPSNAAKPVVSQTTAPVVPAAVPAPAPVASKPATEVVAAAPAAVQPLPVAQVATPAPAITQPPAVPPATPVLQTPVAVPANNAAAPAVAQPPAVSATTQTQQTPVAAPTSNAAVPPPPATVAPVVAQPTMPVATQPVAQAPASPPPLVPEPVARPAEVATQAAQPAVAPVSQPVIAASQPSPPKLPPSSAARDAASLAMAQPAAIPLPSKSKPPTPPPASVAKSPYQAQAEQVELPPVQSAGMAKPKRGLAGNAGNNVAQYVPAPDAGDDRATVMAYPLATLPKEPSLPKRSYAERPLTAYPAPGASVVAGEKTAEQLYLDGARYWDAGDKTRARDYLERALRVDPSHRRARQLLAKSHAAAGNLDLARELLNGSPDTPRNPESAKLNAQILLQQGRLEHAERIIEPWLSNDDPEFIGLMGALRQQQGRYRESLDYYQQAAQLQPRNSKWLLGLAIALEANERYEEAERVYKQALAFGVHSAEAQAYITGRLTALSNNR